MAETSQPPRWSLSIRGIHAISALVVFSSIGMGLSMTHLVRDAGLRFELYQWHKSFGVLAFALILLRIMARLRQRAPEPVGTAWQRQLAWLVHKGMYGFLMALPLTGWAMVSASPLPVPTVIFGLWTLPSLLKPDLALYTSLRLVHEVLSWSFCVVLALHLAGSLAHWRSGIVGSMWRFGQGPR